MPNLNELAALLAERDRLRDSLAKSPPPQPELLKELGAVLRQLLEAMPALVEALRWRDAETETPPAGIAQWSIDVEVYYSTGVVALERFFNGRQHRFWSNRSNLDEFRGKVILWRRISYPALPTPQEPK